MTMIGAEQLQGDPKVGAFMKFLSVPGMSLEGLGGDLLHSDLMPLLEPDLVAPTASTQTGGIGAAGMGTLPSTVTPPTGTSIAGGLANVAKTLANPQMSPLEEELLRGGLGPTYDMDYGLIKPEAPTITTPATTPTPPTTTPTVPTAPSLGEKTGGQKISEALTPPKEPSLEYKAGEKGVPVESLQYTPPPAPGERQGPIAPPEAPTQESLGVKPPGYFEGLLKERAEAFPATRAAALEYVGRRPEEFQLAKKSPGMQMFEAMMQGLAGIDTMAVQDKKTAELKALERDEIAYAMTKFNHEDQVRLAKFQYQREEDRIRRDKLGEQAVYIANNMDYDAPDAPQKMAQVQAMLGAAWRSSDANVTRVLNEAWNPATGKYENLMLSPAQKLKLEIKSKAEIMEEFMPGMPKEYYTVTAAGGKWQEWVADQKSMTDYNIQLALKQGDYAKAADLYQKQQKMEKAIRNMQIDSMAEMANRFRAAGAPEEFVSAWVFNYLSTVFGMDKDMGTEIVKARMAKEGQAARGGSQFNINSPENQLKIEELRNRLYAQPINRMNWAAYANYAKDAYGAKAQMDIINEIKDKQKRGEAPTPEDMAILSDYSDALLAGIRDYMPLKAAALRETGQLPTDIFNLERQYREAVEYRIGQVSQRPGISDLDQARELYRKYHADKKARELVK